MHRRRAAADVVVGDVADVADSIERVDDDCAVAAGDDDCDDANWSYVT